MTRPVVVAARLRSGTVALNVLTGALRARVPEDRIDLRIARDGNELCAVLASLDAPALVLWSFYSTDLAATQRDLDRCRSLPDAAPHVHVAGGVHATAEPESTLRMGFDVVGTGEGEQTVVDLFEAFARGEALRDVPGTSLLEDGVLRSRGAGQRIALDDWPPFNETDLLFNAVEITRGCVYACAFCQTPYVFKARFRHRSVENLAGYAARMRTRGMRDLRFLTPTCLSYGSDDTTVRLDRVEALLTAARAALGPEGRIWFGSFPSEVRPEHVTDESVRLLRRLVDNDNLVIGGQSGSQRLLDATRRGHTVEDIVRAVERARAAGFVPNVDMLYGLPGETPDDVAATQRLLERLADLGARVHSHTFLPLPGTPLRDAPPGRVDVPLARTLRVMESRGQAYGPWRKQEEVARHLARRR